MLNLTKPYRKVTIAFIAKELSLNESEVEALLVDMILDQKLLAHIDQIKGHVILQHTCAGGAGVTQQGSEDELFSSLSKWADKLAIVNENFGAKMM